MFDTTIRPPGGPTLKTAGVSRPPIKLRNLIYFVKPATQKPKKLMYKTFQFKMVG